MIFNNKFYRGNPLHLYSHDIVDGELKLSIVNNNKAFISKIFVMHKKTMYELDVNSSDSVIELSTKCKDVDYILVAPIIKEAIIDSKKVELEYDEDFLFIVQPKSIASMKDEKYLYIQKMVKYNGCKKENVKCSAEQFRDYWHCTCGSVNLNSQEHCIKCGIEKEKLFSTEVDNSIEEVETKNIVKNNLYICAWFAIISFIQFIVVDIMMNADIIFKTKLATSPMGMILRFGVLPISIISTVAIVLCRKRYLLEAVKVLESIRFGVLLFINIIFNISVLKASYSFFIFLSLNLMFIPFYIYQYFNVKKNKLNLICAGILLISLIGGVSQEAYYSQYTLTVKQEGITLTLVPDERETYVIPDTINGIPVTTIFIDSSFDYSNVKELHINKNLKDIIITSSRSLPSLEKVVIDEENEVFYLEQGIIFSHIENNVALVPAYVTEINVTWQEVKSFTIYDCPNLEKVTISNNVTTIERVAFENCESLKEVIFEEGSKLVSIDENAFANCVSLKEINLPKSIQYIGRSIFKGCSSLEKVTTPFVGSQRYYTHQTTNDDLAAYLFGPGYNFSQIDNVNLKELYITDQPIYDNVTFYNCMAEKIVISGEAMLEEESLGVNAFYGCKNLTSFVVPEGVTTIKENCFSDCENLQEIFLPSSLKYIGENAFSNCKSLKNVVYSGESFEKIEIKDGNSALKSAFFIDI